MSHNPHEEELKRLVEQGEELPPLVPDEPEPNGLDLGPPPDFDKRAPAQGNSAGRQSAPDGELRFKFTQFADIKLDTEPPYLIDKILPRVGVVVVWGPPKCGKTFWVFDIEMHVALGWDYRGHRVQQGAVLHIACEGVTGLGARKEAWRIARLSEDADDAAIPFYLCKDTALDLIAETDTVIGDIGTQYGALPIRIITIDTLNRSLNGSESKDEDMTKYLRAAAALAAQFQCLVVIIHHCGYDQTHPRGHTSLRGGADADIAVKKEDDNRVLTAVKSMRDGPDGAQTLSKLVVIEVGRDDSGEPITSCVIEPDDQEVSVSPAKAAPKKTLPPKIQIVRDALVKAIDKAGEPPPPTAGDVPSWVRVVPVETWRAYYYAMTPAEDEKEKDKRKKTFQRAREVLQQAPSDITIWNNWVWLNPTRMGDR